MSMLEIDSNKTAKYIADAVLADKLVRCRNSEAVAKERQCLVGLYGLPEDCFVLSSNAPQSVDDLRFVSDLLIENENMIYAYSYESEHFISSLDLGSGRVVKVVDSNLDLRIAADAYLPFVNDDSVYLLLESGRCFCGGHPFGENKEVDVMEAMQSLLDSFPVAVADYIGLELGSDLKTATELLELFVSAPRSDLDIFIKIKKPFEQTKFIISLFVKNQAVRDSIRRFNTVMYKAYDRLAVKDKALANQKKIDIVKTFMGCL